MSRIIKSARMAKAFAGREWKFLVCFLLVAQFAWAIERFLDRTFIELCIGNWSCRR